MLENNEIAQQAKERYTVRPFATTSEAIEFTRNMALFLNGLNFDPDTMDDLDLNDIMPLLDPEKVKYFVTTFITLKNGDPIDYERDFISDIQIVFVLAFMVVFELGLKAQGKPEAGDSLPQSQKR